MNSTLRRGLTAAKASLMSGWIIARGRHPVKRVAHWCLICRGDRRRTRRFEEGLMARTVSVQSIKGMKAEATIGPHRVVLDAPAEAGGGDEGPSPAEMLLGAIGA
jgi:hypothetical protein